MPYVHDGIGTWYWGKRNLITRNGPCEFCGRQVELKSYDTTLFFVVLFVPLIPLKRKRIINQCPRCKRHRAVSLAKWDQMRTDSILKATKDWQANQTDPQLASALIGNTVAFQDLESFHTAAPLVGKTFAHDADVQIALAGGYDRFGEMAEAESAYRRAVSIRVDDNTKAELAKFLLRSQRPADAEALLVDAINTRQREKIPLLLALVQAYQSIGQNDDAARLVDQIGTAFPDLLSDANFQKIQGSARKYAGTNKHIKTPGIGGKEHGARKTSWLTRNAAIALVTSLLLIAGIWYTGLAFSLGRHDVQVINGTDSTYSVNINDQRLTLPAHGHTSITLPEGTIHLTGATAGTNIEQSTVELHTSFWGRPFNRRTFVLNPDRLAVIGWEETEYVAKGSSTGAGVRPQTMQANKVLYDFPKVDYLFEPFPQSLTLDSSSKNVRRTRIDTLDKLQPGTRARAIEDELGKPEAAAWARRFALTDGNNVAAMALLQQCLDPDAQLAFLRAHLDDHPLKIEWHRQYQGLIQMRQPAYDLVSEYRKRLATDATDPALQYLLARVLDDAEQANVLFEKSAAGTPPCAYAIYALAWDAMSQGQFDRALEQARRGLSINPKHLGLRLMEVSALNATGQLGPAMEKIRLIEGNGEEDYPYFATEVALLGQQHDLSDARLRIMAYTKQLRDLGADDEIADSARKWLEADMQYAAGDIDGYTKTLASMQGSAAQIRRAIEEHHFAQAWKMISPSKPDLSTVLTIYIGATAGHDAPTAGSAWAAALSALNASSRTARALASAMSSSSQAPPAPVLRNWVADPLERSLMLTAIGLRYPQHQSDYFPMAKRLNFGHQFPCRLIEQVLAKPPAGN